MEGRELSHQSRLVLDQSRIIAKERNHGYIGTEHILFALAHQQNNLAYQILENLGAQPEEIRKYIELLVRVDEPPVQPQTTHLTKRGKKVLELAFEEAEQTSDQLVEPWHLLAGLLGEQLGIAAFVLKYLGGELMTLENIRQQAAQLV